MASGVTGAVVGGGVPTAFFYVEPGDAAKSYSTKDEPPKELSNPNISSAKVRIPCCRV